MTKPETETKATKSKMGRPSGYSKEIADTICTRLGLGESLRAICRDPEMPSQSVIYKWLQVHEDFVEQYARARDLQADTHFDMITDIADETPETVPVYDKEGNVIDIKLDSAYIQWQRQRIEARKWAAMKLKPKKYGDRQILAGDDNAPVVVENSFSVFGELLEHMKLQRQSEG